MNKYLRKMRTADFESLKEVDHLWQLLRDAYFKAEGVTCSSDAPGVEKRTCEREWDGVDGYVSICVPTGVGHPLDEVCDIGYKVDDAMFGWVFRNIYVLRKHLEEWLAEKQEEVDEHQRWRAEGIVSNIHEYELARSIFIELAMESTQLKAQLSTNDIYNISVGLITGGAKLTREMLDRLCKAGGVELSDVIAGVDEGTAV